MRLVVKSLLASLVLTVVLYGVRCQTSDQLGNYKYAAVARGNLMIVDFDLSGKNEAEKKAITSYRAANSFKIEIPNETVLGYILTSRNIESEHKKGRASFMISPFETTTTPSTSTSSTNSISRKGRDVNLICTQPVTRRLLQTINPSISDRLKFGPSGAPHKNSRLLAAFTSSNTDNKSITIPTYFSNISLTAALNYLMIFHLFTVVYWLVTIYMVLINPFFEYARKSVRIFWVGQYAFYFQFLSLLGYLSTWFYTEFDLIVAFLSYAHRRFFGLDYTWFSTIGERNERYDAYIGKFSDSSIRIMPGNKAEAVAEGFYIVETYLPQMCFYFIVTILSLIPTKGIKEIFVSMRLGCTLCFGVFTSFISMSSIFQFFMGSTSNGLDWASVIFGFIMILIPLIDVVLMKMQAMKLQETSNFWTVPKAKGSFYFDIVGYTGHKKYRDYYPFALGEAELILLMAMLIPACGTSSLTQAIVLLVFQLFVLVAVALLPQFMAMKIMDLVYQFFLFLYFIFVLVIEVSSTVSEETAKGLTIWMTILLFFLLCWILIILTYRIINLMTDASSTYGEKAKPIPPQKIKTAAPRSFILP